MLVCIKNEFFQFNLNFVVMNDENEQNRIQRKRKNMMSSFLMNTKINNIKFKSNDCDWGKNDTLLKDEWIRCLDVQFFSSKICFKLNFYCDFISLNKAHCFSIQGWRLTIKRKESTVG